MSQATNDRVRLACEQLLADGRDVTFTAVATESDQPGDRLPRPGNTGRDRYLPGP